MRTAIGVALLSMTLLAGCGDSAGDQFLGKWVGVKNDKRGDTIDFYLSPTRSAKAAKRFLGKALRGLKHWEKPATLNTDKAPSYGAAITELKREGKLDRETAHRQVKYLNNVIEADHGKLKILIKPVRGFKSIPTAYATIAKWKRNVKATRSV